MRVVPLQEGLPDEGLNAYCPCTGAGLLAR